MDLSALTFLLAAGAAAVLPFVIYRRRELQVRGRWLLAGLRAATLVLALLLLWNPQLPSRLAPQGASNAWVLLDRSVSMSVSPDEGSAWDIVRSRALTLAGSDARIATFGDRVQLVPQDSLDRVEPDASASRLAAALERAAEAGAQTIVVVSDLRVPDGPAALAVIRRTRAAVTFEDVSSVVRNVGIGSLSAPRGVAADTEVAMDVVLQGEGAQDTDSVIVEVREDGRLVTTERAVMPAAGRQERLSLVLPPPAREGRIRYSVAASLPGDRFADDDERIAHVEVGPEVRGVVLISLRPTWEPRFVLPVLQQVTGLSARGYLRLADGRYLTAGGGAGDRAPVAEEQVQRALDEALLIVLHGVGGNAPEWLTELSARSGRVLILAHDAAGAELGGVEVGLPQSGEWYVVPELTPSPLAADLAGAEFSGLPPLSGLLPMLGDGAPPLLVQRDGAGQQEAVVALVRDNGRRRAVTLASGFWRWGFRDGPPREAYRRLWAAVSGWLLANEALAGGPGVRPASSVIERGRPIAWVAPGMAGDTVMLSLERSDTMVAEARMVVPADETFTTPAMPPGTYGYTATEVGGDPAGVGLLDVERFTSELLIPSADLEQAAGDRASETIQAAAVGRPLRTHPLPYVLLLIMLCTEWVARRRMGLR